MSDRKSTRASNGRTPLTHLVPMGTSMADMRISLVGDTKPQWYSKEELDWYAREFGKIYTSKRRNDPPRDEVIEIRADAGDALWWGAKFTSCERSWDGDDIVLMSSDGYTVQRTTIAEECLADEPSDGVLRRAVALLKDRPAYGEPEEWESAVRREFSKSLGQYVIPPLSKFEDAGRGMFLSRFGSYSEFLRKSGVIRFVDLSIGDVWDFRETTREQKSMVYSVWRLPENEQLVEAIARCHYRSLPAVVRLRLWIEDDDGSRNNPWARENRVWLDACDRLYPTGKNVVDQIASSLRHMTKDMDWEVGACGGPQPPVAVAIPDKEELLSFLDSDEGKALSVETASRFLIGC